MRTRSRRAGAPPRSTVALLIAVLAVVLAAAAALAPARKLQAHYSWPPQTLPGDHPTQSWYTPLLIARHTPAALAVRLPCGGRPLPHAQRPLVVLATARHADATNVLAITRASKRLRVTIGGARLADVVVPDGNCAFALRFENGSWSLTGPGTSKNGSVAVPDVDGLFSGLDLRAGKRPLVDVTSAVYATRTTVVQTVLRILALLGALTALGLVVGRAGLPGRPRRVRPHAADFVVVALLAAWWVIGPAYFDDGWIMAGERNFLATGNFSAYYDSFGVSSSVQYWLLWLQHFFFDASSSLVVLRVPALVCLVATWFLCRWILGRTSAARSGVAVWSLAAMFSVGALAWGMTLRPEPEVALLVLGVLACVVAFVERGTAAPLALAAVLVALAVTAHPAGLLSLAPVLVAAPALIAWARGRTAIAATIVLSALAVIGVLLFIGTDVHQLRSNVSSLRSHGAETAGWRDELTRYDLLSRPLYGPPMRRAWVALALLAVAAYVLRRRRPNEDVVSGLLAPSLGIGFLLLIVTPAKIPWHFGTLIGVAAVAVAAESARLARGAGWHVRPFVVVGAAMVAAAWAWFPRNTWSDLDLRTLDWTLGFEHRVTAAKLAGILPLLVLAALAVWIRRLDAAAWRTAAWTVPVLAVPLILFTVGVLVADAKRTHSWTLARQNLDSLRGDPGCGLANDAAVPSLASMRAVTKPGAAQARVAGQAPVPGLARYLLGPAPAASPWFPLPAGRRVGFFATGDSAGDALRVEWRKSGHVVASDPVADSSLGDPSPQLVAWRFFPQGSLPARPPGADAMRIAVDAAVAPGGAVTVTAPVTYADEPLRQRLAHSAPALALPNLLTYVPCIRQPAIHGVAEVPRLLVGQQGTVWPLGTGSSPFDGLPDLYNLVRLPLSDSAHPPGDVVVYDVDTRLPGAALAPVD